MAKTGIQVCDIEMFHSVMLAGKDNQHTRLVHLLYLLYLQKKYIYFLLDFLLQYLQKKKTMQKGGQCCQRPEKA